MPTVTSVIKFFPVAKEGFTSTTASTTASGATTVAMNSVAGYNNNDVVALVIEPTSATNKQVFTGTVDTAGVQITGVVWTEGTNVSHAAGATVVDYWTATHMTMLTKGLLVSLNQDGTIKNNAITSAAQITDGVIGDAEMATAVKPVTLTSENTFDHIASGCVWSGDAYASTLLASMTSGVIYIAGKRLTVAAVTSRAFTASRDTYVDFSDNGDGTALISYSAQTNNAVSPALTGIRDAIIVSGAGSIASVAAVNQGQENKILPIASSIAYAVTDSLGNLICPRDPNRQLLGRRQITGNISTSSTSAVQAVGLSAPVIVPTGRKVKVTVGGGSVSPDTASKNVFWSIWSGVVASGTQIGGTQFTQLTASFSFPITLEALTTPSTTSVTFNLGYSVDTPATGTIAASSTAPVFIKVELL